MLLHNNSGCSAFSAESSSLKYGNWLGVSPLKFDRALLTSQDEIQSFAVGGHQREACVCAGFS